MIAQDVTNSIGSIIRLHKNGDIPNDNPYQEKESWKPELYQIGFETSRNELRPNITKSFYLQSRPQRGRLHRPVTAGSNYGWKQIAWGGTNYSGSKVGDGNAWEPGFLKPDLFGCPP